MIKNLSKKSFEDYFERRIEESSVVNQLVIRSIFVLPPLFDLV